MVSTSLKQLSLPILSYFFQDKMDQLTNIFYQINYHQIYYLILNFLNNLCFPSQFLLFIIYLLLYSHLKPLLSIINLQLFEFIQVWRLLVNSFILKCAIPNNLYHMKCFNSLPSNFDILNTILYFQEIFISVNF